MFTRQKNLSATPDKTKFFLIPLLSAFLFLPIVNPAQQLSAGDIAFTGYNSAGDDQFSFIATKDIPGNVIIYFTDKGFADEKASPGWTTNEGILKYLTPASGLDTGDIIIISDNTTWQILTGSGTITEEDAGFNLNSDGDQIFAFQTEDTEDYTPTFIAGINMNNKSGATTDNWGNIDASNNDSNETDLPDALTNGVNAIWVTEDEGEKQNAKYNNTITAGSKINIDTAANNYRNWNTDDDYPFTLGYQETTSTIAAGDWNSVSTWNTTNGIPGKITEATISHDVTITADCAVKNAVIESDVSLTVNTGETFSCEDTLTINSDVTNSGSLIVNGTVTGTLTYNRYMSGNRWYMVSSPVSGQDISDFIIAAGNNIPDKSGDYGMMDYNTASDGWNDFFTASTSGNMLSGIGYCLRRETSGTVSFNGSITTTDVIAAVSDAGNGWNLVGNPYSSAINVTQDAHSTNNFLTVNTANLDPSYTALYLWDEQDNYTGGRNDFVVINNAGSGTLDQDYIQAGQGFFIKAKSGASQVTFTNEMRTAQSGTNFKSGESSWPTLVLSAKTNEIESKTILTFNKNMSNGLDVGYDAGAFKFNSDLNIYSRLVEDNGVDFTLQCLPFPAEENLAIPIGVDASEQLEITFSTEMNNWVSGMDIMIEDRDNGTKVLLNNSDDTYRTTLINSGAGRFYLYVGENLSTGISEIYGTIIFIPDTQSEIIKIYGEIDKKSLVAVYDITGKKILETELLKENQINFSNVKNGIYIIKVKNDFQSISKKIIWMK